jgi:hypothetical protein
MERRYGAKALKTNHKEHQERQETKLASFRPMPNLYSWWSLCPSWFDNNVPFVVRKKQQDERFARPAAFIGQRPATMFGRDIQVCATGAADVDPSVAASQNRRVNRCPVQQ